MFQVDPVRQADAGGALLNQANHAGLVQDVRTLVQESLNQTLAPPKQIGEASALAAQIHQINEISMSKSVQELVQAALNQTLIPPKQIGEASSLAAQIRQASEISTSKTVQELVEAALDQTLANPKHSIAQSSKNLTEAIPVMQRIADSLTAREAKMRALKTNIEGMTKRQPINEFLSDMRQEVMREIHVINAIIDQTEFAGNRPLSEDGSPTQIALTDGSFLEVQAEDLELHAAEEDLETGQGIEALLLHLQEKLGRLHDYQESFLQQLGQLETGIKQGELKLIQDMGVDPSEINIDLAVEIAALASGEAVSWAMKESLDAQQAYGLLKDPIK